MYLLRGGGGRVKVWDSPCFNTYETLSSVNPTIVLWFIKKERKKNFFFQFSYVTWLIIWLHLVSEVINLKNVYLEINDPLLYLHIPFLLGGWVT